MQFQMRRKTIEACERDLCFVFSCSRSENLIQLFPCEIFQSLYFTSSLPVCLSVCLCSARVSAKTHTRSLTLTESGIIFNETIKRILYE